MSFLQNLLDAAASEQAQFNIFLTEYGPNATHVFAFVEGRDDSSFYRRHIDSRKPGFLSTRFYRMGNKKGVLEAFAGFTTRYREDSRVLFFVDRDHSDFCEELPKCPVAPTLYVTDCYSVENFLATEEGVRNAASDLFAFDESQTEVLAAEFNQVFAAFEVAMRPLMAWCIAVRRQFSIREKDKGPQLDNIELRDFVQFSADSRPSLKHTPDTSLWTLLSKKANVADVVPSDAEVLLVVAELVDSPARLWLRGKAAAWLVVRWLSKIAEGLQIKVRTSLSLGNFVEVLGPRVDTPATLDEFLMEHMSTL